MSVYLDRKTGRFFVQFEFRGIPYKKRMPDGSTKDEANQLEIGWKHDLFLEEQGLLKADNSELWEVFVDKVYLEHVAANHSPASLDKAINICKASMPFLRGKTLRKIKPADIEQFKAARMQTPTRHGHTRMASTIHREMSIISRVFSLALRNEICDRNPCSLIDLPKFDNVQDTILYLEDEEKFLIAIRNRLQRDICLTVLYTGLRQNDVLGLRTDQVDFRADEIKLIQGKTKRRVNIPLLPRLRDMLQGRKDNGGVLFFPSYRTGNKLTTIKNGIRFACIRAGIEKLTIRDLRRTFGTRLHENGFDDKTIADLLGHADLRSVHRYKRGTEIKKKAILSLENMVESAKKPTSDENGLFVNGVEASKNVVEMRRIELLASALRTQRPGQIIH
jgi:integrase